MTAQKKCRTKRPDIQKTTINGFANRKNREDRGDMLATGALVHGLRHSGHLLLNLAKA
jgi:hypothetical protein